jgi:hypothetical protein
MRRYLRNNGFGKQPFAPNPGDKRISHSTPLFFARQMHKKPATFSSALGSE